MAKKRVTLEEDMDRLAENLFNKFGDKITDRSSFSQLYDAYMEGEDTADELKPKAFKAYVKFLARGKKRLTEVRKLKTKEVVTETFIKDKQFRREVYEFKVVGKVKGRIVFSRPSSFKIKGKVVTRFIDRKGRFVSVKKAELEKAKRRRPRRMTG